VRKKFTHKVDVIRAGDSPSAVNSIGQQSIPGNSSFDNHLNMNGDLHRALMTGTNNNFGTRIQYVLKKTFKETVATVLSGLKVV
jgi:hypothetical protein